MGGKAESEKKKDETLHFIIDSEGRKIENSEKNIGIKSKVLWKFTTNKTTRKPTGKKSRTRYIYIYI